MNVPYITIDPTFPHHMNSFDNVAINEYTSLVTLKALQIGQYHLEGVFSYLLYHGSQLY